MKLVFRFIRFLIALYQIVPYYLTFKKFSPPYVSAIVLVEHNNKYLLINRTDGLGLALPGGFVNLYETVESAAIREFKEETGLEITLHSVLGIISGHRKGTLIGSTDIIYHGILLSNSHPKNSIEGICGWYTLNEALDQGIAFGYEEILIKYEKDKKNNIISISD